MSFQAYLDRAEEKAGLTPQQILDRAHERGYGAGTAARRILAWLTADLGLGRGHEVAPEHVIKNGPLLSDRHVGSRSSHRDDSAVLRLDGAPARTAGE